MERPSISSGPGTVPGSGPSYGRKAAGFAFSLLVVLLGAFTFAAPVKAESFNTTLDHGQINLGFAFQDAEILPAPPSIKGGPLNMFPLLNLWGLVPPLNPPTLKIVNGDLNGSTVSIGKDRFQPPIMIVPNPIDQSDIPITIRANDDLTGTWDEAGGKLDLSAPFEVRVLVGMAGTPPTTDAYCRLDLGTVALTTGANARNRDYVGSSFTGGITGDGAITGSYVVTEDSGPVGMMNAAELPALPEFAPPDCSDVDSISKGIGTIWLAHGIDTPTPVTPPECPEFTEGTHPGCQPIPCPDGTVGENEPDCVRAVAKITRVVIKPKKRAIKAGKKIKLRVRVVNKGDKATWVKVKIRSKNKRVKVPKIVKLRVMANSAGVKKFNVRANRKARGKAVIIAWAAGKQGKSVLKVKPVNRKR